MLSSLLGGGVVAAAGYALLKDRLIQDMLKIFAKRSELNAVGSRVNGLETVVIQARDAADTNSDAIIRLQEGEKHRWEPVLAALDRINARLDAGEKRDERHATMLDQLEKRMERHDNGRGL